MPFARRSFVLAALSVAVAATPVQPQQQQQRGRALTIEDYYRVRTVGAPDLSPDGKWVAFTVSTRVEATNGTTSEVWAGPFDGSAASTRLSPDGVSSTAPAWLDGGRLRFGAGGAAIVIDVATGARVDSGAAQQGAAPAGGRGGRGGNGGAGGAGQLSPDAKYRFALRNVAVTRRTPPALSDFEKRHEERFKGVTFDWLNFQQDAGPFPVPNRIDPELNPPQELFVTPASGGAEKQVTTMGLRPAAVAWSPDGSRIAFTADSQYRNERSYGKSDVYTVTPDGAIQRLTSNIDNDYTGARFSPDGAWILSTREAALDRVIAKKMDNGGPTDLVLIPAKGGPERVLTADWDYLPTGAQWSPDGKYVYFTGGIGGTSHLFRVAAAGGKVEQVTKGERRISGYSYDRSMTHMAYTVNTFDAPPEIFVANIDGTGERQISHIGDAFASEVALSKSERLSFKSPDGTPIEGWLMFPHDYRPAAGPYPLVVISHGGPHSATQYGFDFKPQYLAANGYFVLQVNFRSSTGYGEKFLWGTWGAWGTKDGQDVLAGIDHVIGKYPIARNKVATMGHSYGGFMTNWLITQYPDRFAAAIPGAGIVNWVSDYGTADIARTKETEFYGTPWEPRAREIMIKQSPLTYAGRVKTPTLFINGEIDQRVPYSEAEQFYVALKKNGVPAKVIQYAGQPHGIAGSWNAVHRMLNEKRWLDQWMK